MTWDEASELAHSSIQKQLAGMLRPRGPCGLGAKSFGLGLGLSLGLTVSRLGLGLMASLTSLAAGVNVWPNVSSTRDELRSQDVT